MVMMKIKFTSTSIVAVPDKIKTITDIPGMLHQEQGFNGKVGWKFNNRMGFQFVKGDALNFLKYSAIAENATRLEERYEKIELAPEFVMIDGIKCYKLTCYPPQVYHLSPQIIYINSKTYLIHKIKLDAVSDMGTVTTTVTLSDYKKFFGRMVPTNTTMVQMNITIKMHLLSFKINQSIPNSTFDPPPKMIAPKQQAGQTVDK